MLLRNSDHLLSASGSCPAVAPAVEALHRRCGVYTKPQVVRQILDSVGWQSKANLATKILLEPAAGDGAFVVEAALRLVGSFKRHGIELRAHKLADRIHAFELHPREANLAKSNLISALRAKGVYAQTATACANAWIRNADFLLANLASDHYTHVVGNPPYIRWSKVPPPLKKKYETVLPKVMIGGDLFLPFLDKALESLRIDGRCGFICSDRWRFMAFAEGFRKKWLPRLVIESEHALLAVNAFVDDVDSYPTILIASKRDKAVDKTPPTRPVKAGKTLEELGYIVKVGPALGHTPAYLLESHEENIEPQLLQPWIDGSEITEGAIAWRGRRVIAMHGDDGKLIELNHFPLLKTRLERFRNKLKLRSIVANGARWFRPIDRVRATDWSRPKLLIPELAKIPRLAIDRSGAIPSHGVYAIFAPDDDVDGLYEKLRDGKLAKALENIAPKVKGGYVRCYRRFLLMVRV